MVSVMLLLLRKSRFVPRHDVFFVTTTQCLANVVCPGVKLRWDWFESCCGFILFVIHGVCFIRDGVRESQLCKKNRSVEDTQAISLGCPPKMV